MTFIVLSSAATVEYLSLCIISYFETGSDEKYKQNLENSSN